VLAQECAVILDAPELEVSPRCGDGHRPERVRERGDGLSETEPSELFFHHSLEIL
jgi:hypothetical protein